MVLAVLYAYSCVPRRRCFHANTRTRTRNQDGKVAPAGIPMPGISTGCGCYKQRQVAPTQREKLMARFDDFILGNDVLHARLVATTEVLSCFVSRHPNPMSLSRLERACTRSGMDVKQICAALERSGLIQSHGAQEPHWMLTCDAAQVTLEDVFRCVLEEQASHGKTAAATTPGTNQTDRSGDVNLFLMQAMITIHQSVFKHLRQFSLDRLTFSAAGMFPAPRRSFVADNLDDAIDIKKAGRKAGNGSLMQDAA